MEALGINLGYLLVQILNFLILFVVLRVWVYKPILGLLAKRREAIAKGLEDARIAAEARENAEKDAEKIISDAQSKASQIVREATERAESVVKDITSKAQSDVDIIRKAATAEAEQERNRMLGELRGQVAALATSAAQKLIGATLDEQRQHSLIQEFFSGVKDGKVVLVEGLSQSDAESADITSALPLTRDEQTNIKKDVIAKIGSNATIVFKVDPSILGGLVIQIGDKVIDGSVAGNLEKLSQRLH